MITNIIYNIYNLCIIVNLLLLQGDPFLFLGWGRLEEFLVIVPVLEGLQGSRHQLTTRQVPML